jgi:hypothetical protein
VFSHLSHLSLPHSLCAHYDADLAARDALLVVLGSRLAKAERPIERRRALTRASADKVELKKACQSLEEIVQCGKEDSSQSSLGGGGDEATELRERVSMLEGI